MSAPTEAERAAADYTAAQAAREQAAQATAQARANGNEAAGAQ